jgi:hypothetical protein
VFAVTHRDPWYYERRGRVFQVDAVDETGACEQDQLEIAISGGLRVQRAGCRKDDDECK